jgi:hypothetical protein
MMVLWYLARADLIVTISVLNFAAKRNGVTPRAD